MTAEQDAPSSPWCFGLYGFGLSPNAREARHIALLCEGAPYAPPPARVAADIEALGKGPLSLTEHAKGTRYGFCTTLSRRSLGVHLPVAVAFWNRAAEEAELEFMVVAPECRREGLGRALLENSHASLWTLGVARVCLEVSVQNWPARSLYESWGYQALGMRKGYYQNGEDALVLALPSPLSKSL